MVGVINADQPSIVMEYIDDHATEPQVESGASPTSILVVPVDGLTPKVIQEVKNENGSWAALRSIRTLEPLKPITMRTLQSDPPVDWSAEEAAVRRLVDGKTVRKVTLVVPAADGSVIAYVMPEPSDDDEAYLTGILR